MRSLCKRSNKSERCFEEKYVKKRGENMCMRQGYGVNEDVEK